MAVKGGLTLAKVHEFAKVPGTNQMRLVAERPYIRLRYAQEAEPVFVQGGAVYSEGGDIVPDLSDAFWAAARGLTPESRRSVGLTLPEERPGGVVQPAVARRAG